MRVRALLSVIPITLGTTHRAVGVVEVEAAADQAAAAEVATAVAEVAAAVAAAEVEVEAAAEETTRP